MVAHDLDIHRLPVGCADFSLFQLDRFEYLDQFHVQYIGGIDNADATGSGCHEGIGFAVGRVGPEGDAGGGAEWWFLIDYFALHWRRRIRCS